jgi:hypothetical protein
VEERSREIAMSGPFYHFQVSCARVVHLKFELDSNCYWDGLKNSFFHDENEGYASW